MEKTLIQGIKRLRVLTPYDYDNMDELVQDLSTALEETSVPRHSRGTSWWHATAGTAPKSSAISGDDSESSLDGRGFSRSLEAEAAQSDSDERLLQRLCAWRRGQCNAAESDSVNENFLPVPPRPQHRRKRKFKRMAVDPPPIPMQGRTSGAVPQESASMSRPKASCSLDAGRTTLCGKRKRSIRERSLESLGRVHRRSECCDEMELEICQASAKPHGECSSSSLSSSESDAGIHTNDEGREGDDEQSDFFHEGGPACGIPDIVAWWEEDALGEMDSRFQAILAGTLPHLSDAARKAYKEGRQIRAGRRRLTKSMSQQWSGRGVDGARGAREDLRGRGEAQTPHPALCSPCTGRSVDELPAASGLEPGVSDAAPHGMGARDRPGTPGSGYPASRDDPVEAQAAGLGLQRPLPTTSTPLPSARGTGFPAFLSQLTAVLSLKDVERESAESRFDGRRPTPQRKIAVARGASKTGNRPCRRHPLRQWNGEFRERHGSRAGRHLARDKRRDSSSSEETDDNYVKHRTHVRRRRKRLKNVAALRTPVCLGTNTVHLMQSLASTVPFSEKVVSLR